MKLCLTALALIFALYAADPARAWSRETHMTTGAIAFDDLERRDPALLAKLLAIAAAHPDRARFETNLKGLTGRARVQATFEWLARWPDDVRDTPYDHPKWHYELRVISSWAAIWPFRNGTASEGFDQNFKTLANPKAKAADRAVALGWLLHIVGDIQQPLHAGHWASSTYPLSDRAGTIGFVRRVEGGAPIELHEFWDRILDRSGPPNATARAWALPLQRTWPRARLPELGFKGAPQAQFAYWLDESLSLARMAGYRDAFLRATRDADAAPIVSPRYNMISNRIAQRRVVTGGYRIADTLRMALKAP
jgi:hypothetical protein